MIFSLRLCAHTSAQFKTHINAVMAIFLENA